MLLLVQPKCGLPIFHYFSALKIIWLMENCESVKEAIAAGNCLFGTVDTWLIWVCSVVCVCVCVCVCVVCVCGVVCVWCSVCGVVCSLCPSGETGAGC